MLDRFCVIGKRSSAELRSCEEPRERENSKGMCAIAKSTCITRKPMPCHQEGINEVMISKNRAGTRGLFQPQVSSASAVIH